MPKSVIKKTVCRKIKTADFESLDVNLEITEEVEWENFEEREKKTEKITEILLEDLKKTYNKIVSELSIDRCVGVINAKNSSSEKKSSKIDLDF